MKIRRLFPWLLLGLILITQQNFAQRRRVKRLTKAFLHAPALEGALTGIRIERLDKNRILASVNADKLFIPASTMKTLAVFNALQDLGKDFRWHTEFLINGNIRNDTLYGNLIIRAHGDPTFGGPRMGEDWKQPTDSLITRIQSLHIRVIRGDLILQQNGDWYPAPGSWPVEDIGTYYGTGAWSFNFNDNKMRITMRQNPRTGAPVQVVALHPDIPGYTCRNRVVSGKPGTGDEAYLYGEPTQYFRTLIGEIEPGDSLFDVKAGIPNPPLSYLRLLKIFLERKNIGLTGTPRIENNFRKYPGEKILLDKTSAPLIDIAKTTLNFSVNHYAEAMMRLIIEKNRPADGYIDKDSLNAYFRRRGFRLIDLEDGSGLAPDNLIAPQEYTAFLKRLVRRNGLAYVLDILPHAGEEGYARYFLAGHPENARLWLKSGSVSKVRNYTGIFQGKSGHYYVFAIMVNHFKTSHKAVKKAIEKYLDKLILQL